MKKRVTITKVGEQLHFYLKTDGKQIYLFTQAFSKGVYNYFKGGRSEQELRAYKKWNRNPRLDKTIEKIPMYTHYALFQLS